jgi:hypothetical protein
MLKPWAKPGGTYSCRWLSLDRTLPHPAAKGRRAASDIHRHIEDLTLEHVYQLALGVLQLVVQATQHTPSRV